MDSTPGHNHNLKLSKFINIKKIILFLIIIFGVYLRIFPPLTISEPPDSGLYKELAQHLIHGHGFSRRIPKPTPFYKPIVDMVPGYPAFLATIFTLTPLPYQESAVLTIQFIMELASAGLLFLIVRLFHPRLAYPTLIIRLLYIPFITSSRTILTETLFMFLYLLSFYLVLVPEIKKENFRKLFFWFGIIIGLATMVRSIFAFTLLPFFVWFWLYATKASLTRSHSDPLHRHEKKQNKPEQSIRLWNQSSHLKTTLQTILFTLIGLLLILGPWTYRNYTVYNKFIPLQKSFEDVIKYNGPDSPSISSFLTWRLVDKPRALFTRPFMIDSLNPPWKNILKQYHYLILAGFLIGSLAAAIRPQPLINLCVYLSLSIIAIHTFGFNSPRYVLPAIPFMIPPAVYGVNILITFLSSARKRFLRHLRLSILLSSIIIVSLLFYSQPQYFWLHMIPPSQTNLLILSLQIITWCIPFITIIGLFIHKTKAQPVTNRLLHFFMVIYVSTLIYALWPTFTNSLETSFSSPSPRFTLTQQQNQYTKSIYLPNWNHNYRKLNLILWLGTYGPCEHQAATINVNGILVLTLPPGSLCTFHKYYLPLENSSGTNLNQLTVTIFGNGLNESHTLSVGPVGLTMENDNSLEKVDWWE